MTTSNSPSEFCNQTIAVQMVEASKHVSQHWLDKERLLSGIDTLTAELAAANGTAAGLSDLVGKYWATIEELRAELEKAREKLTHYNNQDVEMASVLHDLAAAREEIERVKRYNDDCHRALDAASHDMNELQTENKRLNVICAALAEACHCPATPEDCCDTIAKYDVEDYFWTNQKRTDKLRGCIIRVAAEAKSLRAEIERLKTQLREFLDALDNPSLRNVDIVTMKNALAALVEPVKEGEQVIPMPFYNKESK